MLPSGIVLLHDESQISSRGTGIVASMTPLPRALELRFQQANISRNNNIFLNAEIVFWRVVFAKANHRHLSRAKFDLVARESG